MPGANRVDEWPRGTQNLPSFPGAAVRDDAVRQADRGIGHGRSDVPEG